MKAPWWQWPNILSLDAPVIALVWQESFARTLGSPVSGAERLLLFLVVWCVYAADHIADGLRLGVPAEATARHRFAHRHSGALAVLVLAASVTGLLLVGALPPRVLSGGLLLAVIVGGYFLWNHLAGPGLARSWAKEGVVGVVFAAGCALGPITAHPGLLPVLAVGLFALLCIANCLFISRLERELDILRGESSLAVKLPPQSRPARVLAAVVACAALPFWAVWPGLVVSLILSAVGLWCGVFVERRFGREFAAVWADAVLLSPVLTWPWLEWGV
jgi:hypothetical protein